MAGIKTSQNDPIRVDFLDLTRIVGAPRGRIGLTIAPGKQDRLRHWDRDLDTDLTRLRTEYSAQVLVSLIEAAEYELLKITQLPSRASAAGLEVRTFPIEDVSVPADDQLDAFAELIDGIVASVQAGQHVIVHCRGGLGRSGVVAACCLVKLGMTAKAAIQGTRQARPGAIEVPPQEQWIRRYAEHIAEAKAHERAAIRTHSNLDVRTRQRVVGSPTSSAFRGCLLGGALGDALGYPVEFLSHRELRRKYGTEPPVRLAFDGREQARISDDTQMTLFTAEGLIRGRMRCLRRGFGNVPVVVGLALLRWYETQTGTPAPFPDHRGWLVEDRRLHVQRAPGTTCMAALRALASHEDPQQHLPTIDHPPNDSKGCGAVMRAAPCGLALGSRDQAFQMARDTGVITHGHPSGYLSGAYLAALIWDLVRGAPLADAMVEADALLAQERGSGELEAILARVRTLATRGVPDVTAIESLGGGWVGEEALAIALLCALTFDETQHVEDVLWRAAAHSGDSDSTAAIAGNLIGARYGVGIFPSAWLRALELRDVTDRLAVDLFAACVEAEDLQEYPET